MGNLTPAAGDKLKKDLQKESWAGLVDQFKGELTKYKDAAQKDLEKAKKTTAGLTQQHANCVAYQIFRTKFLFPKDDPQVADRLKGTFGELNKYGQFSDTHGKSCEFCQLLGGSSQTSHVCVLLDLKHVR